MQIDTEPRSVMITLFWSFFCVFRIVTVILVVISVVWIPILQSANSGQLYVYIQSVTSYLAPPVTAIFVMAVFWKRTNEAVRFHSSKYTMFREKDQPCSA